MGPPDVASGEQIDTMDSIFSRLQSVEILDLLSLFSIAHSDSGLNLIELCEPLAYYTEHNKMKDLSNKNVSPVPRTNSSDLHHFQTLSRAANAKTGRNFDSFLPPSSPV